MKLLWLINLPTPEASSFMGIPENPFGGWLYHSSKLLSLFSTVDLFISFPVHKLKFAAPFKIGRINYLPFYSKLSKEKLTSSFIDILETIKPNIVHIHGTEFYHSYVMTNVCNELKVPFIVSIQGITKLIYEDYYSDLPNIYINKQTIKDLIKNDSIETQRNKFKNKSIFEEQIIKSSNNFIIKNNFDYKFVKTINPLCKTFHCNEIIRENFYKSNWEISNIIKNSIFISQWNYPIKGFHKFIQCIPILIKEFPDLKVFVSGSKNNHNNFLNYIFSNYYSFYIRKILKKLNIEKYVVFLGKLSENEIINYMLKSNVFVLPSQLENSPNSLIEAMVLGLPIISSSVGGVPDMVKNQIEAILYQNNSPSLLAKIISNLFIDNNLALRLSSATKLRSKLDYNPKRNIEILMGIYESVINV
jgi:glycosyltransferase involved in cell wall biosynthesis